MEQSQCGSAPDITHQSPPGPQQPKAERMHPPEDEKETDKCLLLFFSSSETTINVNLLKLGTNTSRYYLGDADLKLSPVKINPVKTNTSLRSMQSLKCLGQAAWRADGAQDLLFPFPTALIPHSWDTGCTVPFLPVSRRTLFLPSS